MNVKEYRQRTRKELTCPSGLVVKIRKVQALDYLRMGILPDTLRNTTDEKGNIVDPAMVEKMQKMILTTIVVPTSDFRIVDKDPFETADDEISWREIEDNDFRAIMEEVNNFSRPETESEGGIPGGSLEQFSEE